MGALTLREINKNNVSAEVKNDSFSLQLQRFGLVNILSTGFRDHFQQPISWGVSAGLDRFIEGKQ
jgi:hypothetical protein